MNLTEFAFGGRVDKVRSWLDRVEQRLRADGLTGEDVSRILAVEEAAFGPLELKWRRVFAVRLVGASLRRIRAPGPPASGNAAAATKALLVELAEIDQAFDGLVVDEPLARIMRGAKGGRPWEELRVTAYLALKTGALGIKKVVPPKPPTPPQITAADRLLRQAMPVERSRRRQRNNKGGIAIGTQKRGTRNGSGTRKRRSPKKKH
jgi:hypothetical protein